MSAHALAPSSSLLHTSSSAQSSSAASSHSAKQPSTWVYTGARVPAWANSSSTLPASSVPPSTISAPSPAPDAPQTIKKSFSATSEPNDVQQKRGKKRKLRTPEEVALTKGTAARFALHLSEDRKATLRPDVNTPFKNAVDVVQRLLPYHIWQIPEDASSLFSEKGKARADSTSQLREEIAETRFAINCTKRLRALEADYQRISTRSGKRAAPDDIQYALEQAMLEAERNAVAEASQELREEKSELERLERNKKISNAQAAIQARTTAEQQYQRQSQHQRTLSASQAPVQSPAPQQYTYSQPPAQHQQYPYQQQVTYNAYYAQAQNGYARHQATAPATSPTTLAPTARPPPSVPTPTTSAPSTTPNSAPAPTTPVPPAAAQNPRPPSRTGTVPKASGTAIPVQMPPPALGQLVRLGIMPVLASSVPAGGARPACVITGPVRGGIVPLEINIGMLQSAQVNGLALLLNSLTNNNRGGAGSIGAGPSPAPAGSVSANGVQPGVNGAQGTTGAPTTFASASIANVAQNTTSSATTGSEGTSTGAPDKESGTSEGTGPSAAAGQV